MIEFFSNIGKNRLKVEEQSDEIPLCGTESGRQKEEYENYNSLHRGRVYANVVNLKRGYRDQNPDYLLF
jgi:hypothetical protein